MFQLSQRPASASSPRRPQRAFAAVVMCAAMGLSACGGDDPAPTPSAEPETTSAAPVKPTQEQSVVETPTPTPSENPGAGLEHNPKLKQLKLNYVTVDVPEGWTGEVRDNGDKVDDIKLVSPTDKSTVRLIPINIALSPRKSPDYEAANMCGSLARKMLKEFSNAKEGPRDIVLTPKGYAGYTCGVTGTPAKGSLAGVLVDAPVLVITDTKGEAIIQMSQFPVKNGDPASADAALFALKQSTFNWAGKPLV